MLRLRAVDASYGSVRALDALSLIVPRGSVVALLGANGAGKTTTLRCISGLVRPDSGTIELDGELLNGLTPAAIAERGVVHLPEGRGVFPALTVRENLTMAQHAVRVSDSDAMLQMFPVLATRMQQPAGTLSGGEQQMLAMARAVLRPPKLLLADELSRGLAPLAIEQIYAALRQMRAAGTTIVLVEQYATHALSIADLVAVLHRGRLRFLGDPAELRGDAAAALWPIQPMAPSKRG